MTVVVHILSVVCALVGLGVVLHMQRSQRLRERHAIWWIVAGLLALVISLFPQLLSWLAGLLGVEVPTNLVFFVSIALLFGVCLQLSSELTRAEAKTRVLAEKVAMLELRIDEAHGPAAAPDTDDQTSTA
ncbi:DUF2304 domain-containing protein [Agrococcus beijingensis]|uniref:DUF2304 domain-containing protein n=1 Tax=Agrococcus beijingensis TaxID=3068634 RepID=UPI002740CF00|nr:DUF2304 domain-containing protein [Agrococcus sp. REN33]